MFHLPEPACITEGTFIGVDGCRDGWIAAVIENGQIHIEFYETMEELLAAYPDPDRVLIDMAIGLPYSCDDLRPDDEARKFLGRKGSSIFPIPSKAAVYADGEKNRRRRIRLLSERVFQNSQSQSSRSSVSWILS